MKPPLICHKMLLEEICKSISSLKCTLAIMYKRCSERLGVIRVGFGCEKEVFAGNKMVRIFKN